MKVSKTKIKFNAKRKTNPLVSHTLALALKNKGWLNVAKLLAGPRRKYSKINLSEIDEVTTEGDTVIIVGKVLSSGELKKRIRICSLGFSASALDKLKKVKAEVVTIADEIKKNPKGEGIKIIS
jgi:ribosomal protein L18E